MMAGVVVGGVGSHHTCVNVCVILKKNMYRVIHVDIFGKTGSPLKC